MQLGLGALRVEERRGRAHLRQQAIAGIDDLHFDFDRRLGAVGGGDDLPQHAAPLPSRKRVDGDLGRLPLAELGDAALVDVGLDLERVQVDDRTDRAGRQRPRDLPHHHRGDDFADLGRLRGDRAVEGRAHDHVAHVDANLIDARARRLHLRLGRVVAGAARHALLPQRRLPRVLALRLAQPRLGLVELRLHVRALQDCQNVAGVHLVADVEVQLHHFAGDLRRDLRLLVRDEVAGRAEEGRVGDVDRRLDHDRLDGRRAPRHDEARVRGPGHRADGRERDDPPDDLAEGEARFIFVVAVDAQRGEVGTGGHEEAAE